MGSFNVSVMRAMQASAKLIGTFGIFLQKIEHRVHVIGETIAACDGPSAKQ